MIQFNHLTYTYPGAQNPVLEDITLEIDDADFVLLSGPSGAGKSIDWVAVRKTQD